MNRKALILIFTLIITLLLSGDSANAHYCVTRFNTPSCLAGETPMLSMWNVSNSHAASIENGTYAWNYTICCNTQTPGITFRRNCTAPGSDIAIKLNATNLLNASNAHVEIKTLSNYATNVCMSTTPYSNVDCQAYDGNCADLGSYLCVASISANTNAHIANCTSPYNYTKKICCNYVPDSTPPTTSITLSPSSPTGKRGWYNTTPVTATLTCYDGLSGCNTTRYRIGAGPWVTQPYSGPISFPINSQGNNTISFYSNDSAGNQPASPNISYVAIDTVEPNVGPTSDSPDPVQSFNNITFTSSCTDPLPGSGCINVNITTYFGSCVASGSSCNITTPDNTRCIYATNVPYNATAEDNAGWKNKSVNIGTFTIKKAEGCLCNPMSFPPECFSGVCMGEPATCNIPSSPLITSSSGDITLLLGAQGRLIVNVRNPLKAGDRIEMTINGGPSPFNNWVWFDSHRYDNSKYRLLIELNPEEEKSVAIDMFGGKVMSANMRVVAKSTLTGLETEISKNVFIEFSDDGITSKTPEIGWTGVLIVVLTGAFLVTGNKHISLRRHII